MMILASSDRKMTTGQDQWLSEKAIPANERLIFALDAKGRSDRTSPAAARRCGAASIFHKDVVRIAIQPTLAGLGRRDDRV
jgi:hypothetical protein